MLDARCMHPGRTARNHLRAIAALSAIPDRRVDEVLGEVGLDSAADQRAGSFSLGMRQRLALAGALLGEPEVLLLDEPSNGLDPDGIRWLRNSLSAFAANGGTVFVSSHLIGELEMFADDLIVVGGGRCSPPNRSPPPSPAIPSSNHSRRTAVARHDRPSDRRDSHPPDHHIPRSDNRRNHRTMTHSPATTRHHHRAPTIATSTSRRSTSTASPNRITERATTSPRSAPHCAASGSRCRRFDPTWRSSP